VQHRPQEFRNASLLVGLKIIHLVENEEHPRGLRPRSSQIFDLDLRDWRIRGDDKECCVALEQYLQGRIGVVSKCRADARRIDEHGSARKDGSGVEQFDARDSEMILWIRFLGDKAGEEVPDRIGIDRGGLLRHPSVAKAHANKRFWAPGDEGGDRSQRNDCRRQQRSAEERIDEAALATLELAENSQVQTFISKAFAQTKEPGDERGLWRDVGIQDGFGPIELGGEAGRWLCVVGLVRHLTERRHAVQFSLFARASCRCVTAMRRSPDEVRAKVANRCTSRSPR
jgi:hypothetical protein